jgi:hypothetical protein
MVDLLILSRIVVFVYVKCSVSLVRVPGLWEVSLQKKKGKTGKYTCIHPF